MKVLAGLSLTCAAAVAAAAPAEPTGAVVTVKAAASNSTMTGPAANFTGKVLVTTAFQSQGPGKASGATVTFEPGAHTAWHTHPHGQVLVVTAGVGLVQQEGRAAQVIRPGDVVNIPPGARHWHGAIPTSSMTHVAIAEKEADLAVTWQEKVDAAAYDSAAASAGFAAAATQPGRATRAQALMGDVAPKLAELTDQVLFGDVWARPGLSRRDRSLATVSALIALNRPDQLRSHITLGLQNGLTKAEISELITQMAFYTGWPNAINAASVARDAFGESR